eukprot:scaffold64473_cov30-Tisochrysis_lutea.AAC.4
MGDGSLSLLPPLHAVAASSESVMVASSSSSAPFVRSLSFKLTRWTSSICSMLATRSTRAIAASTLASALALAERSRNASRLLAAAASSAAEGRGSIEAGGAAGGGLVGSAVGMGGAAAETHHGPHFPVPSPVGLLFLVGPG